MALRSGVMKNTLKSLLRLIHYWFPVAVGWSTTMVIQRATGSPIFTLGFNLYLLMIWAAYSLDRLVDPPSKETKPIWLTVALWFGFLIPSAFGTILVFQLPLQTISVIVLFSMITLLYSKLKKIPFLKSVLVAVVWIWAGVALPFQNHDWFAWHFWTQQTSLPLVILFATSVILCDFKDQNSDHEEGVLSLPVLIGVRKSILFVSAFLLITGWLAYKQGRIGMVISSAALIALAQFPSFLTQDSLGPLMVDAALTIPGVLIALHLV